MPEIIPHELDNGRSDDVCVVPYQSGACLTWRRVGRSSASLGAIAEIGGDCHLRVRTPTPNFHTVLEPESARGRIVEQQISDGEVSRYVTYTLNPADYGHQSIISQEFQPFPEVWTLLSNLRP